MDHVTIDDFPDHAKRPDRAISQEQRARMALLFDMLTHQAGEPLQSMTPEEFLSMLHIEGQGSKDTETDD